MREIVSKLMGEMDEGWASDAPHVAVAALFAEDGTLLDMTESDQPMVGRAAIESGLDAYTKALAPLRFDSRLISDDGETAVIEWTGTGVHSADFDGLAPTGKAIEIKGVNIWQITPDGEIAKEVSYWDSGVLLRQLGVL